METKSCKDCRHFRTLVSDNEICNLKSPSTYNKWKGHTEWITDRITLCFDERQDSKGIGFFKLFSDKTRCGVAGKNWEKKDD